MGRGAELDYDVVVVGAGPTGLTCANLLGAYGVRTLLVERNVTTVQEPRAVSIDDESLRTMQAIGAAETVLSSVVAGYGSEYLTPSGRMFLKVEPSGTPYGFPRRNAFRQPVLEAQLRVHLAGFAAVDTLFGWRLEAFDQGPDRVCLDVVGPEGEQRSVRCAYLIGADGASSFVREALKLPFEGRTFSEKWLIVDCEDSPPPSRQTLVFCDARRPCIALPGPGGTRRFEFKLLSGDDPVRMTDPAITGPLLVERGAAPQSRVVRRAVYTFHARLASRWSRGRVFLAGDACHLTPPFAGQGMNSGLRDAHNLTWKLRWVLSGVFRPKVLDSYQQERRDHVADMIRLALRMGRIMAPRSWLAGFLTQTGFRILGLWPPLRDYFGQMKYKPMPRFAEGLIFADYRPRRRTSVGRLLPQPRVQTVSGERMLDDLLGDGFSVVGFTDLSTLKAIVDIREFAILQPRLVLIVAAPALADVGVTLVSDPSGAFARELDAPKGRIFLVRPDRYVMAAFRPEGAPDVARRLGAVLATSEAA